VAVASRLPTSDSIDAAFEALQTEGESDAVPVEINAEPTVQTSAAELAALDDDEVISSAPRPEDPSTQAQSASFQGGLATETATAETATAETAREASPAAEQEVANLRPSLPEWLVLGAIAAITSGVVWMLAS
jgi:hypothetical protein